MNPVCDWSKPYKCFLSASTYINTGQTALGPTILRLDFEGCLLPVFRPTIPVVFALPSQPVFTSLVLLSLENGCICKAY